MATGTARCAVRTTSRPVFKLIEPDECSVQVGTSNAADQS